MAGTHDDAVLIVELAKWSSMLGLDEAARDLLDDDFDPETAEVSDVAVGKVLTFFETVATLVKNGLLNGELVHDWLWVEGTWAKVGPAVGRARAKSGEPRLYENYEALAASRLGA